MKIDKDIKHVLNMRWQHHAGRDIPFDVSWMHCQGYIDVYLYYIGMRFRSVLIEGVGKNFIMWRDPQDVNSLRKKISGKIRKRAYLISCFNRIKKSFNSYKKASVRLKHLSPHRLSNQRLTQALHQYYTKFQYAAEGVSTLIELINSYGQSLSKKYKLPQQALTLLSTPLYETTPIKEEREFLRLISKLEVQSLKINSKKAVLLINVHFNKYCRQGG